MGNSLAYNSKFSQKNGVFHAVTQMIRIIAKAFTFASLCFAIILVFLYLVSVSTLQGMARETALHQNAIQPNPLTAIIAYAMIANALTKKNANSDPLTAWLEKMCSVGYQAMNGRLRRSTHLCQTAEIRPLEYECATAGDVARSFNNSEQCWLDCKDRDDFEY